MLNDQRAIVTATRLHFVYPYTRHKTVIAWILFPCCTEIACRLTIKVNKWQTDVQRKKYTEHIHTCNWRINHCIEQWNLCAFIAKHARKPKPETELKIARKFILTENYKKKTVCNSSSIFHRSHSIFVRKAFTIFPATNVLKRTYRLKG